jgi:DNA-binding NarL/FixJ family response regulator
MAHAASEAIQILIVDDHPLFRDALRAALSRVSHRTINIHEAPRLNAAEAIIQQSPIGLVLLDLQLDDGSGFEGLARLRSLKRELAIVIVSATQNREAYATAKALGARGYLPKTLSLDALTSALEQVLDGADCFPDEDDGADNSARDRLASLTPAQLRVIKGLSDGLLNKQIAYEMGISEATVKAHMTAILRKLGANNRTQALLAFKEATSIGGRLS